MSMVYMVVFLLIVKAASLWLASSVMRDEELLLMRVMTVEAVTSMVYVVVFLLIVKAASSWLGIASSVMMDEELSVLMRVMTVEAVTLMVYAVVFLLIVKAVSSWLALSVMREEELSVLMQVMMVEAVTSMMYVVVFLLIVKAASSWLRDVSVFSLYCPCTFGDTVISFYEVPSVIRGTQNPRTELRNLRETRDTIKSIELAIGL